VARLAEEGQLRHEKLVVVRAVRIVTIQAVLPDGGVFPEEGSPLFGVAGQALLVRRRGERHMAMRAALAEGGVGGRERAGQILTLADDGAEAEPGRTGEQAGDQRREPVPAPERIRPVADSEATPLHRCYIAAVGALI
jgi:hypothetical protein